MKDKTFSERLNAALDKERFPAKNKGRIQLLAEMVGLSHRGASKWINGESCPPSKKYMDLALKLSVREEWLRTGEGSMTEPEKIVDYTRLKNKSDVPVFLISELENTIKNPIDFVTCNLRGLGELFAIKLETEAMSPRFPNQSIIIFDSKKNVEDGAFILVKAKAYPAPIFRQLLTVGSSSYLEAHNPKFDRLILMPDDKVLGVMVQAIISFI